MIEMLLQKKARSFLKANLVSAMIELFLVV